MAIKTLLVDDELMAIANLKHVLTYFPHFEIIGECTLAEEVLETVRQKEPDVAFLDIEMPRIKGMELASLIRKIKADMIIIFVTAYRDYALKAFEVNANDYLVKPVTRDRMGAAISKIEQQFCLLQRAKAAETTKLQSDIAESELIPAKADGRIYLLELQDILYITTNGRTVTAITQTGSYKLHGTISHWERYLPSARFLRCHNSFIINLSKIEYIEPYFKNAYSIKVSNCSENVPVSRGFARELKARLLL